MKQFSLSILLMFLGFALFAQDDFNIELLANVTYDGNGNDVWGYVDEDGTEYAIVGSTIATLIYSLEDPTNPILRQTIPGANSTWRDMKSWKNHVYVTTDSGADGLLIINMDEAPDNITSFYWKPTFTIGQETSVLERVHNLYIDENGVCYLSGHNISEGGIIFLDVDTDPEAPTVLGYEDERYSHDVYVRGDTMYTSEIYQGQLGIYDISDKSNAKLLATRTTSTLFTHNAWLSDNGQYIFTTDEKPNAFVDAYDLKDLSNIPRLDKYSPAETKEQGVIPHNTHYMDGFIITSWYTDGVVITDVTHPDNMIKVGSYDTYKGPHGGFSGCWGAYPWLPSGILLANDINNGFFVLGATYEQACYLEGNVTESGVGSNLNGVQVELLSTSNPKKETNSEGNYKTGQVDAGMVEVKFSHPEYISVTESVELVNGEISILNVEMIKKASYTVNIETVIAGSGDPLPLSEILMYSEEVSYKFSTDNDGKYSDSFITGEYQIIAGQWGYYHAVVNEETIDQVKTVTIELEKGYQDDFIFDLGWTVDNNASDGAWERGEPVGTGYNGSAANTNFDVQDDLGEQCYVTGNGGGNAGQDDVDGGTTILISDNMDLTWYNEPLIEYQAWFFNDGGFGTDPNDKLIVSISNGSETVIIEEISQSLGEWRPVSSLQVSEFITITDQMTVRFETADQEDNGHLVEAAVDAFFVREGNTSDVTDLITDPIFNIQPNPSMEDAVLRFTGDIDGSYMIEIMDISGKKLFVEEHIAQDQYNLSAGGFSSGVYLIKVTDNKGTSQSIKWVKL